MKSERFYQEDQQIEYRCKYCDDITLHNIISEDDEDEVSVIQCSACEETQNYRPKKSRSKTSASAAKTVASSKSRQKDYGKLNYDKLLTKHDINKALQYATTASFKISDFIHHSLFGHGFVLGTMFPNKIEVLFRDGCKLLICAPHVEQSQAKQPANNKPKKANPYKSKHPSSWQPWSSSAEEKTEHTFNSDFEGSLD